MPSHLGSDPAQGASSVTSPPSNGDETSDPMNLDLNLGPATEPASVAMSDENLDSWIDQPIHRVAGVYGTLLQRWSLPDTRNVSSELNQMMVSYGVPSLLHEGEGSVAAEERSNNVVPKTCENVNGVLEIETLEEKDDVEKSRGSDGSFFDCNICLDLARDPVLTCCGHLFCWPCLYRWLHVHSDAKECPVCKGEVTLKNVTPIYGRGNIIREADDDTNLKIPLRPHARRVESLRQAIQRSAFSFPVDEMIRRLGSRFDLSRDSFHPTEELSRDSASERTSGLLNMILTSRALRREQAQVTPTEVVDLTQDNVTSFDTGENRRLQAVLLRRTQSPRATLSSLSSALSSAERLVEAYFHNHPSTPVLRSPEANPPVDDRDSYSSIQAVINSESQLDTAAEIDSMVSLSTSASSRRNEASRVSDVDSGDSRAHRRRRLN